MSTQEGWLVWWSLLLSVTFFSVTPVFAFAEAFL